MVANYKYLPVRQSTIRDAFMNVNTDGLQHSISEQEGQNRFCTEAAQILESEFLDRGNQDKPAK